MAGFRRVAALALAVDAISLHVMSDGVGWVDPDTPAEMLTQQSLVDGKMLTLVMSDEFDVAGRTFNDGHDPRWTALNKNDYTNNALQFYDHDYAVTEHGTLNLTTNAAHTYFDGLDDATGKLVARTKNFKSAMLQGWNKFCFTGGVVEVRAQLPGLWNVGGLWPALWLMGNLARATYVGSSDWVWPWSFGKCDRKLQPKQLVSACNPYPHFDLDGYVGRGAPEIDLLEAMPGYLKQTPTGIYQPYFSSSLQIAPGIDSPGRPQKGGYPRKGSWYEGMEYGNHTEQNVFFFGSLTTKPTPLRSYQADALSANTQMDGDARHGNGFWSAMHTWRVEWQLPQSDTEQGLGYLRWYYDDKFIYGVSGATLQQKMGSEIPSEPSYLILNTAMSSTWGFPEGSPSGCPAGCDCKCYDCLDTTGKCTCGFAGGFCASLPAKFLVDYVRVYQNAADPAEKVGCSTPERPSSTWIKGHLSDYSEPGSTTPLQPQMVGGGACNEDLDCGGRKDHRGTCQASANPRSSGVTTTNIGFANGISSGSASSSGGSSDGTSSDSSDSSASSGKVCVCEAGWIGPWCRASYGEDPIDWEPTETVGNLLGFNAPVLPQPLALALALIAVLSVVAVVWRARAKGSASATLSSFSLGLGPLDATGGGSRYAAVDRQMNAVYSEGGGLMRVESKESPFVAAGKKTYSYGGKASEEMRKTGFLDSR